MAVRTKQLANGVATTTLTTIYTCPAGETCIVKEIHFYNPVGGATTALFFRALIGGNARGVFIQSGLAANTGSWVDMWLVLQAGDQLQVSATPSSAVQFIVSGTELEGVAD